MHILLVHQFFLEDNGGGGSRWNEMSRIWVEAGHRVTVLAGSGHYMSSDAGRRQGYISKSTNIHGVNIIRCRVSARYYAGFVGRIWAFFSFVIFSIYAGLFHATKKYDLIIVTSPPLFVGLVAQVLSIFKSIPFVLEIRDLWPESAIGAGVLKNRLLIKVARIFERYLYKKAKLIAVLTPAFREILVKQMNVDSRKIFDAPNAADFHLSETSLADFDRDIFRKQLGLSDHFVIIYVGAHGVANHLIQLLDAAEKLKHTKAFFLLIGDGAQKKDLILESERRSLNNVRFMNLVPKSEVFKFIAASEIGISVLKKADIFKTVYSNKTFDYFSCKKPVLMTIDGISRKLIEDADAGSYVEPECPDDLAAQIEFYIKNPDLLKMQGENGYQYAKAHFDRNFLAAKYLKTLERLLSSEHSSV